MHTHAFPDALAGRAMRALVEEGGVPARLDGTLGALLASMDEAGIEKSAVASIATRPGQFEGILAWSKAIRSERILPLPSLHPNEPEAAQKVRLTAAEGFKGLKLHPYYQDFYMDEERLLPIYQAVEETGLVLLMHTGFDFAFPRVRRGDPVRVLRVLEAFPELKLVTTHMGASFDWGEVKEHLLGKPIYTDVSFSIQFMPPDQAKAFVLAHPRDYVLFGTDSPWAAQGEVIEFVRGLHLGADWERSIFFENACRLLDIE